MKRKPLAEIIAKVEADPDLALMFWNVGEDLHYAWFGLSGDEAVERLKNIISHIQTGNAAPTGPSPTRH